MNNHIKSGLEKKGHGESRDLEDAKSLLYAMLTDKDLRTMVDNLQNHRDEITKYHGSSRKLNTRLKALLKECVKLEKRIDDTVEEFLI